MERPIITNGKSSFLLCAHCADLQVREINEKGQAIFTRRSCNKQLYSRFLKVYISIDIHCILRLTLTKFLLFYSHCVSYEFKG